MSTQPGSTHSGSTHSGPSKVDLDRTDELPQLDIAAYEAGLAETQTSLSRTDTWTVEALQDIDELVESAQTQQTAIRETGDDTEALTVNVERILKRIAEVEADIATAHEVNAALQKRTDAIAAERDQQAQRIRTLEAEIERLGEHRALSDEMGLRLQQQLRDQTERADAQIAELQSTRAAERRQGEQEREEAERQIDQLIAQAQALQENNIALQDQLHGSIVLANQRAETLETLGKSLHDEKASAGRLARQLAAKLKDCEMLTTIVDIRNQSIDDLTRTHDELNEQLESTRKQHEAAVAAAADEDQRRLALETQFQRVQQSLATLTAEHDAAQTQIRGLTGERDALLPASERASALSTELDQRATELAQLHTELIAARAATERDTRLQKESTEELARMRTKLTEHGTAMRVLEQTLTARDELLEGLKTQLQTVRDDRTAMAGQLEKARARVKSLTEHVFSRDNQIAELQADLAVHTEALAAIRRDVNRIGERDRNDAGLPEQIERVLEPIDHPGDPILLDGKAFTVGRTTENDISLPSKLVSRHHARLLVGPTGVIIEDAGSTNGCFVNGEEVRQHLMHDGDVLELGDLKYRLRIRPVHDTRIRTNVIPIDSRRQEE